jgi:glycosyltransferase involved in cell wall biosynthesis
VADRGGRPCLSAALIVRDEQEFLPGCLDSIAAHVDEIVIVDTGSKDRSVETARSRGARVYERPWTDDFSAARNHALDSAKSDWILYIDADERLSLPPDFDLRAALAEASKAVAFTVVFYPRPGFTPYREIRLFRNDPRIRFRGVIHETVHPAIRSVQESDGLRLDRSPATILHLGYEGDRARKHARDVPLLLKAVHDNPQRVYFWHQLTEIYCARGTRDAAVETWRRAMEIARTDSDVKQRIDASLCCQTLANFLFDAGEEALPVIDEGLALYPDHRSLLFLRARALVDRGDYEAALRILTSLMVVDAETFVDPLVSYDRRIFGDAAQQLAGVALLRMGRIGEAANSFERAAQTKPGDLGHRARAIAIRAVAERSGAIRNESSG